MAHVQTDSHWFLSLKSLTGLSYKKTPLINVHFGFQFHSSNGFSSSCSLLVGHELGKLGMFSTKPRVRHRALRQCTRLFTLDVTNEEDKVQLTAKWCCAGGFFFEGAKFCSETGGLKWKGSKLCNYPIFQELDTQNCQILLSQVGLRI